MSGSDSLGLTIVLYAAGLAGWAVATAATGRTRRPTFALALVVLEVALVLQAIFDVVALADGSASSPATNLGYLLTSIAVLPVVAGAVRLDPGRWGSAALGLGCVLVVVVSLRLHQTAPATNA